MRRTWVMLGMIACGRGDGPPAAPPTPTTARADAGAPVIEPRPSTAIDAPEAIDATDAPDASAPPVVTGPPIVATPPGVMRLVLVHDAPLLHSEEKAAGRLAAALARRRPKGALVDGSPEEAAILAAWTSGPPPASPPPLPAAWAGAPLVVVIAVEPPDGVEPRRRSSGLGARVVFRPPSTDAVYVERGLTPSEYLDDLLGERGFLTLLPVGAP